MAANALAGVSVTGSGATGKLTSTNADVDFGTGAGQCTLRLLGTHGGATTIFTNNAFAGILPQSGSVLRFYSASVVTALDVSASNANITYYGSLTSASDRRLKTEIEDVSLEACQTLLEAVNPKTYKRSDQSEAGRPYRLGVLAQDVRDALPADGKFANLVGSFMHGPEDGDRQEMLSVSYDRLACVLWAVVKNQQKALQELTQRVAGLEASQAAGTRKKK